LSTQKFLWQMWKRMCPTLLSFQFADLRQIASKKDTYSLARITLVQDSFALWFLRLFIFVTARKTNRKMLFQQKHLEIHAFIMFDKKCFL
jgi:hypothetical protein